MEDLSKLSIKELKQILSDNKVPVPSGIEKAELVQLAQQVKQVARAKIVSPYPRFKQFGSKLDECEAIFLFFHGYGADEHQFDLFQGLVSRKVCFICPKSADEGWWPLNVPEWAIALHSGTLMEKIKELPPGLREARENAIGFVKTLRERAPVNAKLLIGGFSQGGVMAVDLVLSLDSDIPINLASFSAFLVDTPEWTRKAGAYGSNVRALVTHGAADPLIPFVASDILVNLLKKGGLNVTFVSHQGGHTLGDDNVLGKCRDFFEQVFS
jgi:predicted esterase